MRTLGLIPATVLAAALAVSAQQPGELAYYDGLRNLPIRAPGLLYKTGLGVTVQGFNFIPFTVDRGLVLDASAAVLRGYLSGQPYDFAIVHQPEAWPHNTFPVLQFLARKPGGVWNTVARMVGKPALFRMYGDPNDSAAVLDVETRPEGSYGFGQWSHFPGESRGVSLYSWTQNITAYGYGPSAWFGTVSNHPLVLYANGQATAELPPGGGIRIPAAATCNQDGLFVTLPRPAVCLAGVWRNLVLE